MIIDIVLLFPSTQIAAYHAPSQDNSTGVIDNSLPVPIQLIILKHRNGQTGTVDMLFKKRTSTFLSLKKDSENNEK